LKHELSEELKPSLGGFQLSFALLRRGFFGLLSKRAGRQGVVQMDSTLSRTLSKIATHVETAMPEFDTMAQSSLDRITTRPSLGRRTSLRLTRFLVVFSIGVAASLAWQSYGNAARAMIANSSPQLGWLVPQTVPVVQTAPDVVAPAAAAAASPDLQRLALVLASVRQSVDQLAAQLAAGQQQIVDDIAKLQADEQEILHKLSAAPPRPTAAPARKPAPVTPPSSPSAQAR
jgi:hypothetical protein